MISGMVQEVTGGLVITYVPEPGAEPVNIDFTRPWRRISMISGTDAAAQPWTHLYDQQYRRSSAAVTASP